MPPTLSTPSPFVTPRLLARLTSPSFLPTTPPIAAALPLASDVTALSAVTNVPSIAPIVPVFVPAMPPAVPPFVMTESEAALDSIFPAFVPAMPPACPASTRLPKVVTPVIVPLFATSAAITPALSPPKNFEA